MSGQQMASRLHNILSTKAALGMGYGEGIEDLMEMYGRGAGATGGRKKRIKSKIPKRKASAKRTTNRWTIFLRSKQVHDLYQKVKPKGKPRKGAPNPWTTFIKSKKLKDLYARSQGVSCVRKRAKYCKKNQKCIPVKGYTQKDGTRVKRTRRCIAAGDFD